MAGVVETRHLPPPSRTAAAINFDRLGCRELRDVVDGAALAIVIDRFVEPGEAVSIGATLADDPTESSYRVEPSVGIVGATFFDTNGDVASRNRYHADASRCGDSIGRRLGSATRNPLATLRSSIAECTGRRVEPLRLDGEAMSWGVCRTYEPGSRLPPHQDALRMDAPRSPTGQGLVGQLSAVLGLEDADDGGELVLWGREYLPGDDAIDLVHLGHDIDEDELPAPMARLRLPPGRLAIFNTAFLHSVCPVQSGRRRTLSMFIADPGGTRPWAIWS